MSEESVSNYPSVGPNTWIKAGDRFECPITCPECGGATEIVIDEWDTGTGEPKGDGFRLICMREENNSVMKVFQGDKHTYRQSIWDESLRNALRWMKKSGIRVSTGNKF
jgi:hypothetical protein